MIDPSHGRLVAHRLERWSTQVTGAETTQETAGLASSPLAMPGFFIGWLTVGLLAAWFLTRRGHDGPRMAAIGAGLGPMMVLLAADVLRHRDGSVHPLLLAPGTERGGQIDLLVLLHDRAEDVLHLVPTIESVEGELRSCTLARTVAYEWLEGDPANGPVISAATTVRRAAELLRLPEPRLALLPGTPEAVVATFKQTHRFPLVLIAVGGPGDLDGLGNR